MQNDTVIFLNVIEVDPAQQERAADLVRDAVDQVIRHRPGFETAAVAASADGSQVICVVRWRTLAEAVATQHDAAAVAHARRIAAVGRPNAAVYRILHAVG